MDISVFKSYQIDVGVNPGQIPVINTNKSITLSDDPVEDTDAVNKRYVDNLFKKEDIDISDLNTYKQYTRGFLNNKLYNPEVPSGLYDVYREKYEQAIDFISNTYDIDSCPLVKLDSILYEISHIEAANNILKKRKEYIKLMVDNERVRLMFNTRIDKCSNINDLKIINNEIDNL